MRYGVDLPNVGVFGDPALLVELAVSAESAGWDGFFIWDHLLYHDPTWPVANPTATTAAIAVRTSRIRFGTLVTAVARRRPAQLAAELATIDQLSGGRLVFGAGLGSNAGEWTKFGDDGDPRVRADRLDAGLATMDALWSGSTVDLAGHDVRMPLTPVQRPRPPIWCGGRWPAKRPFRRAARWDGVMPTHRDHGLGETMPVTEFAEVVAYVLAHREPDAGDFDIVLEGCTEPGGGADVVAPYADAGLTWWLESLGWWRGNLETVRARIAAGPPR